MNGVTFDAGGLIARDRKDRRVLALISHAKELGMHRSSSDPGRSNSAICTSIEIAQKQSRNGVFGLLGQLLLAVPVAPLRKERI